MSLRHPLFHRTILALFWDSQEAGLRSEAAKEKEELTPYSFRHRYAYYGHNRPQLDGSYRAPKQIADAMGHTLDTHLLSYARFKTRDLAESFDQYPVAK